MNTLIDTPKGAHHDAGQIVVGMTGGEVIRFAVGDNPRLKDASPEQLSEIEISPFGLYWPQLDEDLSIRGLLRDHHAPQLGKA